MMSLLGFGIYTAVKTFSGIDPLKISPKLAGENLLVQLLAFNPQTLLKTTNGSSSRPTTVAVGSSGVTPSTQPSSHPKPSAPPKVLSYKFAIVTDSHNDNDDLLKALFQSQSAGAKFVVGLGDWTDVGTMDELKNAKSAFDKVGLPYYVLPGDHDLWDSRNKGLDADHNFSAVFGVRYQSFGYQNDRFLLIDNSDNYIGLSDDEESWLNEELQRTKDQGIAHLYVFVSTPLYHPSSDHFMGKVEPKLKAQADSIVNLLKSYKATEVFAGDTHFYSSYIDPRSNIPMVAVGAITATRNIQEPRYVIVDQYNDGSYNIEDTEVNQ